MAVKMRIFCWMLLFIISVVAVAVKCATDTPSEHSSITRGTLDQPTTDLPYRVDYFLDTSREQGGFRSQQELSRDRGQKKTYPVETMESSSLEPREFKGNKHEKDRRDSVPLDDFIEEQNEINEEHDKFRQKVDILPTDVSKPLFLSSPASANKSDESNNLNSVFPTGQLENYDNIQDFIPSYKTLDTVNNAEYDTPRSGRSVRSLKSSEEVGHEYRLVAFLFNGYNKNIRPADKNHGPTYVNFEFALLDILQMDTRHRKITINSEMLTQWPDRFMQWNPDEFDGIKEIRVPYNILWYPDIILQNTAESDYSASILNTYAIVQSTGTVKLVSHALLTSICDVDVEYYPFDQQTCSLTFSSWTYDHTKIILNTSDTTIGHFKDNPEFKLENFYSTNSLIYNECCPDPFSTNVYYIQIQRRTKFAVFFYIMPGILINICALLVFSLPAESGEKIGLGINSMIAMIVFLMAMTEKIPPTSELPLAGIYYGVCLAIITANIAFSVFVLNLNFQGIRGFIVPYWLKRGAVFLAKVFIVPIPELICDQWHLDSEKNVPDEEDEDNIPHGIRKVHPLRTATGEFINTSQEGSGGDTVVGDTANKRVKVALEDPFQRRSCHALESIARIMLKNDGVRDKDKQSHVTQEEWRFVSRVLDRILFVVFFLIALLFNVVILTSSPFSENFEYCPYGFNHSRCFGLNEQERRLLIVEKANHLDGGKWSTTEGSRDGGDVHGGHMQPSFGGAVGGDAPGRDRVAAEGVGGSAFGAGYSAEGGGDAGGAGEGGVAGDADGGNDGNGERGVNGSDDKAEVSDTCGNGGSCFDDLIPVLGPRDGQRRRGGGGH